MSSRSAFSLEFGTDGRHSRALRFLVGDRVGLAVFLASICLFTTFWIVEWRINDTLTLMNTLDGMSEGHLHMGQVQFGSGAETPGAHEVSGRFYGRNYGLLTLTLVPLVLLEGLSFVADLRVALVGSFSLVVLALASVVGTIVGRRRTGASLGALLAIVLFAGNLAVATDLDPSKIELYALQVTNVVAGALAVVLTYRLLRAMHGRKVGLFAASLVALGTPIGLWASVPKRHVFTAALALALAYALYQGSVRAADSNSSPLPYRVGSYAAITLYAWVHAPEALLLLIVFAAVDLPTARTDLRSLGAIAVAMAIASIPFVVTNSLVSGSPVTPPRMLPEGNVSTGEPRFSVASSGGSGGRTGLFGHALDLLDPLLAPFFALFTLFRQSIENVLFQPVDVWNTVVRSGYLEDIAANSGYESVNLAVLESAPILAATFGVVPAAVGAVRGRVRGLPRWPPSPERIVDAYLLLFSAAFTLLYLARLPIHAQITVRYLLPVVPALVVLIVRLPVIRAVLANHWKLLLWTYAVAVFIGGQLVVAVLAVMTPGVGEAFQFHAWIGLTIAVPLAGWSLAGRHDGWWGRAGAVLIALATAAITVFLVMASLDYFAVGNSQALPLVRALAEIVSIT